MKKDCEYTFYKFIPRSRFVSSEAQENKVFCKKIPVRINRITVSWRLERQHTLKLSIQHCSPWFFIFPATTCDGSSPSQTLFTKHAIRQMPMPKGWPLQCCSMFYLYLDLKELAVTHLMPAVGFGTFLLLLWSAQRSANISVWEGKSLSLQTHLFQRYINCPRLLMC